MRSIICNFFFVLSLIFAFLCVLFFHDFPLITHHFELTICILCFGCVYALIALVYPTCHCMRHTDSLILRTHWVRFISFAMLWLCATLIHNTFHIIPLFGRWDTDWNNCLLVRLARFSFVLYLVFDAHTPDKIYVYFGFCSKQVKNKTLFHEPKLFFCSRSRHSTTQNLCNKN